MKHLLIVFSLLFSGVVFAIPLSGSAGNYSIIVGSLADANNPVEMAVAPELTRLVVLRERTKNILVRATNEQSIDKSKLQIIVNFAMSIQNQADLARQSLDRTSGKKEMTDEVIQLIESARGFIKKGEYMYDSLRELLR